MRQNRHSTKMYVVHHNTLSNSYRIRIVRFQPKEDSDRIRILFFKNRIGSDSNIHYPIISAVLTFETFTFLASNEKNELEKVGLTLPWSDNKLSSSTQIKV